MNVPFVALIVCAFFVIPIAAVDMGKEARWWATVCENYDDAFIGELSECYQYAPERAMSVMYHCMDKHVPRAGRKIPAYFREVCQRRTLNAEVIECMALEDPAALQLWKEEGKEQWECTKSAFAKYEVEFDFSED